MSNDTIFLSLDKYASLTKQKTNKTHNEIHIESLIKKILSPNKDLTIRSTLKLSMTKTN